MTAQILTRLMERDVPGLRSQSCFSRYARRTQDRCCHKAELCPELPDGRQPVLVSSKQLSFRPGQLFVFLLETLELHVGGCAEAICPAGRGAPGATWGPSHVTVTLQSPRFLQYRGVLS